MGEDALTDTAAAVGSAGNVSAGTVKERGVDYVCEISGWKFRSGRVRSGEKRHSAVVELRRVVNRIAKQYEVDGATIKAWLEKMQVIPTAPTPKR